LTSIRNKNLIQISHVSATEELTTPEVQLISFLTKEEKVKWVNDINSYRRHKSINFKRLKNSALPKLHKLEKFAKHKMRIIKQTTFNLKDKAIDFLKKSGDAKNKDIIGNPESTNNENLSKSNDTESKTVKIDITKNNEGNQQYESKYYNNTSNEQHFTYDASYYNNGNDQHYNQNYYNTTYDQYQYNSYYPNNMSETYSPTSTPKKNDILLKEKSYSPNNMSDTYSPTTMPKKKEINLLKEKSEIRRSSSFSMKLPKNTLIDDTDANAPPVPPKPRNLGQNAGTITYNGSL